MPSKFTFCPHCQSEVVQRTFRLHKDLHYNEHTGVWDTSINEPSACSTAKRHKPDIHAQTLSGSLSAGFSSIQCNSDNDKPCISDLTFSEDTLNVEDDIEKLALDPVHSFIMQRLEEVWEDVELSEIARDLSTENQSTCETSSLTENKITAIARWTILFLGSWSVVYNISMNAFGYLLLFMHSLLTVCGIYSEKMKLLATIIPKTVYAFKKAQGQLMDEFSKYVVCTKCDSIYSMAECLGRDKNVLSCTHVDFPNHVQRKFRQKCDTPLFKRVVLKDGMKKYYPLKTYCYRSIKDSLKTLLDRKGFSKLCEMWRDRKNVPGTYRDVYDGRIWKQFQTFEGHPFLEIPGNYGLILNIDWFQPYKHSPYSVGAIYLSILNLPRDHRYRKENVIIVGIIPGPHEPKRNVNSYIRPMVDELEEMWSTGFNYQGVDDEQDVAHRAALLCCACDIPAARKLCGFLGHNAKLGCSKCKKEFKTGKFGEKTNYGGFNSCDPRNDKEHRAFAEQSDEQACLTKRTGVEAKHGVRYTTLMRLSYYNCITFSIIDPMHNLFLGTAKYMFKHIWADKLNSAAMNKIQQTIDDMLVPTAIGRIPRKIESSFSSFTSDQWKNWTVYFSPVALKDHLPATDYNCWLTFIEACRPLTAPSISTQLLKTAHEKLMLFCRTFEELYGSESVTPNMHLHMHLIQCIIDYGPMHVFWLFAFERMNGVLGSFHTNQRSAEMQIMRKLVNSQTIASIEKPTPFSVEFLPAFEFEPDIDDKTKPADVALRVLTLSSGPVHVDDAWLLEADVKLVGARSDGSLDEHLVDSLKAALGQFCDVDIDTVTGSCHKYNSIIMCGETYGSSDSRLSRSSLILASWCGVDGELNTNGNDLRPGIVRFYLNCYIKVNAITRNITLAYVNWLQKVHAGDQTCSFMNVWSHNLFEPDGPATFMPVQRIATKCVCTKVSIHNETLLAVVPYIRQLYW